EIREFAFHALYDGLESAAVALEEVGIERPIAAVVHAEHDRQDGRLVSEHIALQTHVNGSAASPADAIPAPSGMDEAHVHSGEARQDVALGESCVEPLISDAVAVEDDAVSILQVEIRLGPGVSGQQKQDEQACHTTLQYSVSTFAF